MTAVKNADVAVVIETARLRLRHWKPEDREPFARMNADPRVMEFFPGVVSPDESAARADRIQAEFARQGFGRFAVELRDRPGFIGFTGLAVPAIKAHFTPCVEIAWRLAYNHWGHGFATEAARAVLHYGFETCRLSEVVAFTVVANLRSRRVMEKLGMTHNPADDFDHPDLPEGPLRRHVLYRVKPV